VPFQHLAVLLGDAFAISLFQFPEIPLFVKGFLASAGD